jgi:simple sugar transport system ATP-binding protein
LSRRDIGSTSKYLLEARKITKRFGKVVALDKVDFCIGYNEVVGLVGDNGAGKSTLVKILTGVYTPDEGEVYIKGKLVKKLSRKESPMEVVHQERTLSEQQPLWRNFFMGREITNFLGFIDIEKQRKETEKSMKETLGFTSAAITPDTIIRTLSGGEKRGIEIGRALYFESDLVILDEPTIQLSLSETEKVLNFVKKIKREGKSCVFITHNIYHVYPVADRFVILDRGRVIGELKKADTSLDDLSRKLISVARTGKLQ